MASAADRVRRMRARQREGRAVLRIEVDAIGLADLLARTGFIDPWNADNPAKLRAALEAMIEELATT